MDIQEPDPSKFENNNADHCKQKGSSLLAGESIFGDKEKTKPQLNVIPKICDNEITSPHIAGKVYLICTKFQIMRKKASICFKYDGSIFKLPGWANTMPFSA